MVTATPIFTQTPKHTSVLLTTAETDLTTVAPTNLGLLVTAGASGSKILAITICGNDAACALGSIQVYVDNDGGTNALELYDSIQVPAVVTVAAGTPPFRKVVTYENFVLGASATIYVGTYVTDGFTVSCDYGDF